MTLKNEIKEVNEFLKKNWKEINTEEILKEIENYENNSD